MRIIDPRLWHALTLDDFLFRLSLNPDENGRDQNKGKHKNDLLMGTQFDERAAYYQSFTTPNSTYVLGFDDSHWGGVLDFSNAYTRGMRFAIFKVMDGTVNTKYWDVNRPAAIQAGLIVGEYGWLYPNNKVSCKTQAQAVWNRIKDQPKQLPLTVDFEWTYWGGSPAYPNYTDLDIWVTEFTRLSGYKPMMYSAAGYMNQFGAMPAALRNKFSYFFFANYGVSKPTLPLGFSSWDFWQFTDFLDQTYYAPSSTNKKELDGDYFEGTLYKLQEIANTAGTPPVDPPPTDLPPQGGTTVTTYYLTATGDPTKVFADSGGTSPIAQIKKGVSFTSRARTTSTYYITSPQVGYVKFTQVHLDKTMEDTPPVDPPPVEPPPTEIKITSVTVYYTENGVPKSETLP